MNYAETGARIAELHREVSQLSKQRKALYTVACAEHFQWVKENSLLKDQIWILCLRFYDLDNPSIAVMTELPVYDTCHKNHVDFDAYSLEVAPGVTLTHEDSCQWEFDFRVPTTKEIILKVLGEYQIKPSDVRYQPTNRDCFEAAFKRFQSINDFIQTLG